MKSSTKFIAVAAAIGAGYIIYTNKDQIAALFKKKVAPEKDAPEDEDKSKEVVSGGDKTYSPYQLKVMKLQGIVGAGVDGIVGPNTNKSVEAFFPNTYLKLGSVSMANIDAYLALNGKRELLNTTPADIAQRGKAVWAAMSSAKNGKVINTKEQPASRYDGVAKVYIPTGGYFTIKANTEVVKSRSRLLTSGYIVTDVFVYDKNGSSIGIRQMMLDPRNITV